MRSLFLILALSCGAAAWSQNSSPSSGSPSKAQPPDSTSSKPTTAQNPSLAPPRSDSINASELGDEPGQSSSKDTLIDLSPPADDAKVHPQSSDVGKDEPRPSGSSDVGEFHPWNPHKAAKDIEVGDFYFKRKNYRAAEDRYREALFYKDNDAVATFRLAQCLEKMDQPDEARKEFENYLKILPHGPQADAAHKAIDRLKGTAANAEVGR
jgi:tetratricopeptide (TPR) repeat protein